MKRVYDALIKQHLSQETEMLFLAGPRQVGKTTASEKISDYFDVFQYISWDNENHRELILQGPRKVAEAFFSVLSHEKPVLVFDEIHKHPEWKSFIKGFYDTYGKKIQIVVTGSARLNVYQKGGDSLMGRYFLYRMCPLSVAECATSKLPTQPVRQPSPIDDEDYWALYQHGGFPKPFLKRSNQYSLRWQRLRKQQLVKEDIRDVNLIHDINRLDILAETLRHESASAITYSRLAKHIRASVDTVKRWIEILEAFYYCYRIQPWSRNVPRSLIKEPKVFLWDWSLVTDIGARSENFVATHLLKAVYFWSDIGLGEFRLHYIRTLEKEEVDFLIVKNDEPWLLVEVKHQNNSPISQSLRDFQKQLGAPHAFQVVIDMPYVDQDCFSINEPVIVPAKTFLSQLI